MTTFGLVCITGHRRNYVEEYMYMPLPLQSVSSIFLTINKRSIQLQIIIRENNELASMEEFEVPSTYPNNKHMKKKVHIFPSNVNFMALNLAEIKYSSDAYRNTCVYVFICRLYLVCELLFSTKLNNRCYISHRKYICVYACIILI